MTSTRILFGCAALLALACAASAEDYKKVAEQHEREFVAAMKSGDIAWFNKVAAPDYVEIEANGTKKTKAQSMAEMKQMLKMGHMLSASSKVVAVSGNASKLVVKDSMSMSMSLKLDPKAKKPSIIASTGTYQETWSKVKGKWMIHELRTIKESSTMDGKPMKGGM
jgi:hypothetical protein